MIARRLRIIGVAIGIIGFLAAPIVYWLGNHHPDDPSSDPAMARYYKSSARQTEMMYGKLGLLADDMAAGLKRPGVQAALIAGFAAITALICFYVARRFEAEHAQPPGNQGDPASASGAK